MCVSAASRVGRGEEGTVGGRGWLCVVDTDGGGGGGEEKRSRGGYEKRGRSGGTVASAFAMRPEYQ